MVQYRGITCRGPVAFWFAGRGQRINSGRSSLYRLAQSKSSCGRMTCQSRFGSGKPKTTAKSIKPSATCMPWPMGAFTLVNSHCSSRARSRPKPIFFLGGNTQADEVGTEVGLQVQQRVKVAAAQLLAQLREGGAALFLSKTISSTLGSSARISCASILPITQVILVSGQCFEYVALRLPRGSNPDGRKPK